MNVIEPIQSALESEDTSRPILDFSNYHIEHELGHGEQGIVLSVSNRIGKRFALKFYRPTNTNTRDKLEGIANFKREITILAGLQHKSIVRIYSGGQARWLSDRWNVEEGFNKETGEGDDTEILYYYIMDLIEAGISSIFPEPSTGLSEPVSETLNPDQRARFFESLASQICNAIDYYHGEDITHKDIKQENIRYSQNDETFILVDFGFARHITSPQPDLYSIPVRKHLDTPSILAKDWKKNDIAQLAMVLKDILPSVQTAYTLTQFRGISNSIQRATDPQLDRRFNTAWEFLASLSKCFSSRWTLVLKPEEYLTPSHFGRFDARLRLPVSGSMLLTKEMRSLIDTPEFQLLRGTRQLGPTIFVFPGANHTRFEHSLGACHLTLQYLERLIRLPEFAGRFEAGLDGSLKLIVLAGLLHDIGHYPYSHWIEEIGQLPRGTEFPKHENRAKDILTNSELGSKVTSIWDVDVVRLSEIIADEKLDTDQALLVNSFINSIIDVDKIDYLIRDSIHCGVNYGKGIDLERLLDSLYINEEANGLCFTDKGRSSLLSVITCRNVMYQEVYWHKTVRACDAMFKRFFYEYVKEQIDTIERIQSYFTLSDDQFLKKLYESTEANKPLQELIEPFLFMGRNLYKPAYIYYEASGALEPHDTQEFFDSILRHSDNIAPLVEASRGLASVINETKRGGKLSELDIIVEATPYKGHSENLRLRRFKIWNTRKNLYEEHSTQILTLNEFLEKNRQAYIYCNPKHYDDLKHFSKEQWQRIFHEYTHSEKP